MHPLLTLSYWTSLLPPPTFDPLFFTVTLSVFGFLVLAGIALLVLSKRLKDDAFWAKAAPKFAAACLWIGILGFIHLWIAYEQVYLLGARFWLIVLVAALLAMLARVLHYVLKVLPKTEEAYEEKMRIRKYLPKKD